MGVGLSGLSGLTGLSGMFGCGYDVFTASHEDGTLDEYDRIVDPGGDISVTVAAALAGTSYGLSCFIDDLLMHTVRHTTLIPPAGGNIRLRVYIDSNTFAIDDGDQFTFVRIGCEPFAPDTLFTLGMGKNLGGNYRLGCQPRNDLVKLASNNFVITDAPHCVEIHCVQASTNASANGSFEWWVDGDSKNVWTGIDNFDIFEAIDDLRVGPSGGQEAGIGGTIYIDEIVVRSCDIYIGP